MRSASRTQVLSIAGKPYLLGPQNAKVVRALKNGARSYSALRRKTGLNLSALYVIVSRLKLAKLAQTKVVKGEREVLVSLKDSVFYNGQLYKAIMVY